MIAIYRGPGVGSAAQTSGTPVPQVVLHVANTGGDGVYIRRTPSLADRIKAWPDGTKMVIVGADQSAEGNTGKNVHDPDSNVGWIPALRT